jgi:hypothetical protein
MNHHGPKWARGMRMRLRRQDGKVYLDRWGFETPIGGLYLHHMTAPDPGVDLHDHPWVFWSLILKGGYEEERCESRSAPTYARYAEKFNTCRRGVVHVHHRWSIHRVQMTECHRITCLIGAECWTLVVRGPRRRSWGFYLPGGYMDEHEYDRTVRAKRRDMWAEEVHN